ncbi:MAG: tetratricopeptide repeat protein [Bacteroidales bacterium]|nr:tetratricopeptide repeat protein [Bacteroidales bacterium]
MKTRVPAFFIFLVLILSSVGIDKTFAQDYNIDSLEVILEKSEGIKKIPYYYALTDYYIYNAPGKAIRLANKFLILAEEYDSINIIEYCYQILGESYFYQENYTTSLNYFQKFLITQIEKEDERGIGRAYNNLGTVYRAIENYPEAIQYYEKALTINLKLNDINGLSSTYNNLGVLHEYLNLFAQARDFYKKSLKIELGLNDQEGISTSYLNLGGINLKLRNYDTAIEYCEKSIIICNSLNYNHTLEINYDVLYQVYKKIGNTKKTLLYLEKFYDLKNNRINEESNAYIAELEIKYQTDKKQQEIEQLNKQKKQKSILNIFGLSGLAIFSILLIILIRTNKFRKNNNQILRLRNAEVMQQKEEIEAQRDEIEAQRDEIKRQIDLSELQTNKILNQKRDITDSIEYAKHIQIALFPDKITLQKILKKGFCLFKPKDIVSGDFYWVAEINNKSIIVAADCTGHGVPGAFLSIIGINFLNEIVYDEQIAKPSEILSLLRRKIIKTMVHANRINESKDGIDLALVVIDYNKMILEYAGAYNPLYYIRDHMLNVIKADRMPVGISEKPIAPFTNHTMEIQKGDLFYMFTDGFVDQFGGPRKKKFRIGNLRELLLDIHEKEMTEQKRILYETLINWKGQQPQVDDVLSIGIKI